MNPDPAGSLPKFGSGTRLLEAQSVMTMAGRPTVQDFVKAAVAASHERVQFNLRSEALTKQAQADSAPAPVSSPSSISTDTVEKIASACEYVAEELSKSASSVLPGRGPGATPVMESRGGGPISDDMGSAKGMPPMVSGMQATDGRAATQQKNDEHNPPGGSGTQQVALPPGKKTASAPIHLIRSLAKQAEQSFTVSAGAAVPPPTRAAGESGGASPAGASMVGSNEAATNYTKRDAKATPKADMKAYVNQPALSAATDKVLDNALDKTDAAGAKVASVPEARSKLASLVRQVAAKKGGAK